MTELICTQLPLAPHPTFLKSQPIILTGRQQAFSFELVATLCVKCTTTFLYRLYHQLCLYFGYIFSKYVEKLFKCLIVFFAIILPTPHCKDYYYL